MKTEHQVHILDGLTRGAFDEVVDACLNQPLAPARIRCPTDCTAVRMHCGAKIGKLTFRHDLDEGIFFSKSIESFPHFGFADSVSEMEINP